MRLRRPRRPYGYALAMALAVLTVLLLAGLAYGSRTSEQLFNTTHVVDSMQSAYLAEGGAQYALKNLDGFKLPYQTTLSFATGSVTISVSDAGGGSRRIHSQARVGRVTHLVTLTVGADSHAASWSEVVL